MSYFCIFLHYKFWNFYFIVLLRVCDMHWYKQLMFLLHYKPSFYINIRSITSQAYWYVHCRLKWNHIFDLFIYDSNTTIFWSYFYHILIFTNYKYFSLNFRLRLQHYFMLEFTTSKNNKKELKFSIWLHIKKQKWEVSIKIPSDLYDLFAASKEENQPL